VWGLCCSLLAGFVLVAASPQPGGEMSSKDVARSRFLQGESKQVLQYRRVDGNLDAEVLFRTGLITEIEGRRMMPLRCEVTGRHRVFDDEPWSAITPRVSSPLYIDVNSGHYWHWDGGGHVRRV